MQGITAMFICDIQQLDICDKVKTNRFMAFMIEVLIRPFSYIFT